MRFQLDFTLALSYLRMVNKSVKKHFLESIYAVQRIKAK